MTIFLFFSWPISLQKYPSNDKSTFILKPKIKPGILGLPIIEGKLIYGVGKLDKPAFVKLDPLSIIIVGL